MLTDFDIKLFYLINKNCSNRIFDFLMPFISELGSIEVLILISLAIFFLMKRRKKKVAILLFAGIAITYLIVYFLKNWIARPRPFAVLPDVHLIIYGKKGLSFPSGHAAQSFMAATILSRFFRRYMIFFVIALFVCFSRVYVGLHFISDVVAGALIGTLIGYALTIASKPESF